jgi:DNA-binding GntR family transcriptional regulator
MQHLSLKQQAYQIIKEKLLNLEFEPGSRIREDILAQEISMSRTPVREAMNQLAADGFIKVVPRKGLFCTELSVSEIKGLLDVRENLEQLALEKCIEKITDAQLEILELLNLEFSQALDKDQYKKCNELDSKFHATIAKISGNKKLVEFLEEIEEFMRITRNMEKKTNPREKNLNGLKQHQAMYEAIRRKDIQGALIGMKSNIQSMREHLGI